MAQDSGYLTIDDGLIYSGTYTPTLYNTTNVTGSTAYACHYVRIGNEVIVGGQFDIDPTNTASTTTLGMSLPIASDFSAIPQCAGSATQNVATQAACPPYMCYADTTNNRASFECISGTNVSTIGYLFMITYRIV